MSHSTVPRLDPAASLNVMMLGAEEGHRHTIVNHLCPLKRDKKIAAACNDKNLCLLDLDTQTVSSTIAFPWAVNVTILYYYRRFISPFISL